MPTVPQTVTMFPWIIAETATDNPCTQYRESSCLSAAGSSARISEKRVLLESRIPTADRINALLPVPDEQLEPGSVQWLYTLERRAILPVKWLMCLLCLALAVVRSPDYIPTLHEFVLLVFYLVTNLGFSYLIYFQRISPEEVRPFSVVSFLIDVFVMASFIFLTGGIDSDFFMLFFLVILRGMGFFPSPRMNLLVNIFVGFIYISTLILAAYDARILYEQEFYQKVLLVMGIVFVSWFLIEIQAQQRLQLMKSNRRLTLERTYAQNLLESMTDGVVAFDEDCNAITLNAAARQILHLGEESGALSRREKEVLPQPILRACKQFNQSGREITDENQEVQLHDGTMKTLRLTTRGICDADTEPVGVVAIFEDLSTLRRIEEQLWQSEKLASVGQLAAGVAHELGNPIGIIKSCAEYLQNRLRKQLPQDVAKEPFQEEVEVITSEAERCQRILQELLSYSSQEAVALEALDIQDIINRAKGLISYKVPVERIQLKVEECSRPLWVMADTNLLIQALVNILLNAIQSIEDRGQIIMRCRLEQKPPDDVERVVVEIEDTGCGISPEHLKHIFEPFYTTREEGTGLGLAITQRIMERLGGTIEMESEVGRGSRFRLLLQQAIPDGKDRPRGR